MSTQKRSSSNVIVRRAPVALAASQLAAVAGGTRILGIEVGTRPPPSRDVLDQWADTVRRNGISR